MNLRMYRWVNLRHLFVLNCNNLSEEKVLYSIDITVQNRIILNCDSIKCEGKMTVLLEKKQLSSLSRKNLIYFHIFRSYLKDH